MSSLVAWQRAPARIVKSCFPVGQLEMCEGSGLIHEKEQTNFFKRYGLEVLFS